MLLFPFVVFLSSPGRVAEVVAFMLLLVRGEEEGPIDRVRMFFRFAGVFFFFFFFFFFFI